MANRTASVLQLIQWKHAIKLEAKGLKHSSGHSIRKHACTVLGLPLRTPAAKVVEVLEAVLAEVQGKADLTDTVTFGEGDATVEV